jgi:hypothetical protein
MLFTEEIIIEFFDKLDKFLGLLNYSGDIIYQEYMILILWKYYINNDDNNVFKFSQESIIKKYNDYNMSSAKLDNITMQKKFVSYIKNEKDLLA